MRQQAKSCPISLSTPCPAKGPCPNPRQIKKKLNPRLFAKKRLREKAMAKGMAQDHQLFPGQKSVPREHARGCTRKDCEKKPCPYPSRPQSHFFQGPCAQSTVGNIPCHLVRIPGGNHRSLVFPHFASNKKGTLAAYPARIPSVRMIVLCYFFMARSPFATTRSEVPTSANTAIHMVALPVKVRTKKRALMPRARAMF